MLNLIATHSPRFAAMATNRPYGEDVIRDPAILHRIALQTAQRIRPGRVTGNTYAEAHREQVVQS